MKKIYLALSACILSAGVLHSCSSGDRTAEKSQEEIALEKESAQYDLSLANKLDVFKSLPTNANNPENPTNSAKVKLGHMLYFDTRLSKNNTISCNSCHNLATGGVDNKSFSPGDAGELGGRNSPTVLNAALHSMQFWDGRAKDVEEQAGMPVLNPVEMAIPNENFLIDRLKGVDLYQELFAKAYPDEQNPINYTNVRKAIGVFERKLLTPSRFDAYLNGDKSALTLQEKKGLTSFINVGCATCHNGVALGGNGYQRFGVFQPYWEATESAKHDEGKKEVSGDELDQFMFKTASLRNVAETYPYFHDGSVKELEKAIEIMAEIQLNYKLSPSERDNILAFLKSLSGTVPSEYISAPAQLAQK